ncbi:hypothetical protein Tco_0052252, partial [Tanacetum coccineum]
AWVLYVDRMEEQAASDISRRWRKKRGRRVDSSMAKLSKTDREDEVEGVKLPEMFYGRHSRVVFIGAGSSPDIANMSVRVANLSGSLVAMSLLDIKGERMPMYMRNMYVTSEVGKYEWQLGPFTESQIQTTATLHGPVLRTPPPLPQPDRRNGRKRYRENSLMDCIEWTCDTGIADHAQDRLGDVLYIELCEVGAAVIQGVRRCVGWDGDGLWFVDGHDVELRTGIVVLRNGSMKDTLIFMKNIIMSLRALVIAAMTSMKDTHYRGKLNKGLSVVDSYKFLKE